MKKIYYYLSKPYSIILAFLFIFIIRYWDNNNIKKIKNNGIYTRGKVCRIQIIRYKYSAERFYYTYSYNGKTYKQWNDTRYRCGKVYETVGKYFLVKLEKRNPSNSIIFTHFPLSLNEIPPKLGWLNPPKSLNRDSIIAVENSWKMW